MRKCPLQNNDMRLCFCAGSENDKIIDKKLLYIFKRKLDVRLIFPNSLEA